MPRAADDFEVVVARLNPSPEDLRARQAMLSGAERERAERFFFERDRRRFVAARARLRELLGERLGTPPQAVDLAYGRYGKPLLARGGLHFSLSHCDEVALYGFSSCEIGVDIEALRAGESNAFLRRWTRYEALAKGIGAGLSMPVEALDAACASGWRLYSFFPLPGFIAAVACYPG
jgi:4'-phosphopantetheinyl transferase